MNFSKIPLHSPIQVIPNIFWLRLGTFGQVVNSYIYGTAEGPVVIDTGTPGDGAKIIAALTRLGYGPHDVAAILLTHGDFDHVGGAAELVDWCHAPVVAAQADLPLIHGQVDHRTRIQPRTLIGRLLRLIYHFTWPWMGPLRSVPVDRVLQAEVEAVPGGLKSIHTPGHTRGHTSYWAPQDEVLFTGDALIHTFRLSTPLSIFTEDLAEAWRSVRRLAALTFDVACFGHGPPLRANADRQIRAFAYNRWRHPTLHRRARA